ncbi:alpha-ketoglutarate-dependent dioxygenase AlkB family protein [Frigidibacter sp. ROC022]|uniref:alpha-ketoglutarate-dependent dioxygenase AlkB family protein n=1 Tax=Frigidibacter sp. ROC022 TaxID=2971796 RepID=UPI00215A4368|nr:alpha-ketoglutarate-dependent dioxygenase AlkB [Frigidibacter sp. ROC022]MCR8724421.1 alpha-ketoglutarate-dependent dioxygenase AlkB [Frigidibacter sp. ROC022]
MAKETGFSVRGVQVFPGFLDVPEQVALLAELRRVVAAAPLFSPQTRMGGKMSVRMTSAGEYGWYSDRRGYRYVTEHPLTGAPWPPIPPAALAVWRAVAGVARLPECCLVNFYQGAARMGLHQDRDEADFTMPVVSISLGDEARFRIGSVERGGKTESVWLRSGDVAVLAGPARLVHHGVDKVAEGSSTLLPRGGRINLTMRVVT